MPRIEGDPWFRVGASTVGVFAGIVLGLCAGILAPERLESAVFGGALAGAATGAAFPEVGMRIGEGTLHFLFGLFAATNWSSLMDYGETKHTAHDRPKWLHAASCFGVLYAVFWVLVISVRYERSSSN